MGIENGGWKLVEVYVRYLYIIIKKGKAKREKKNEIVTKWKIIIG